MLARMSSLLVAATLAAAATACEPNNQGYAPEQPIIYSHAVHAGTMKINCQYCHFNAEHGKHAGIPPATICMNCHKQVQKDHPEIKKVAEAIEKNERIGWVRVHFLPDHVHFDHSVHVAGKVQCQTCHGPVEEMGVLYQWAPLTMGWCIDCHRTSSTPEGSAEQVRASPLTDCAVCHH